MDLLAVGLLAILLLTTGLTMTARLLRPDHTAYRQGQADARRYRIRRDQVDAYWRGYNQQMYGHPDGPVVSMKRSHP